MGAVPGDILEAIDGALADYAVSYDAMRWCPDGKEPPCVSGDGYTRSGTGPQEWPAVEFILNVDVSQCARVIEQMAAAFAELGIAVIGALKGFAALTAQPDLTPGNGSPGPLCINGQEYARRRQARRRRARS